MADPKDEGHPAELTASDFGKECAYRVGTTQGKYSDYFRSQSAVDNLSWLSRYHRVLEPEPHLMEQYQAGRTS